jgi:hypothetical protein
MTARPVPRAQLPAGVTCAMTAGGAPLDAETLAAVEQFHTFLRSHKDIGETKACAATYGDGNCPHIPGREHAADTNPPRSTS